MDNNEKQNAAATSMPQENPKLEKPRPTKEEIMEKRISMVKERNARVARIDSPLGGIMFNIMRQFDQAYIKMKGQIGDFGGISIKDGSVYIERASDLTLLFSELTEELSKEVGFKYYVPQELKEVQNTQPESVE